MKTAELRKMIQAAAEHGYCLGWTEGSGENPPRLSGPVLGDEIVEDLIDRYLEAVDE